MHIRIIMILPGIGVFLPVLPTHAAGVVGDGTPASCTRDALATALASGGDCAAGRTRGSDGAPALARVALRDRAHSRDQTRGHESGARCDHMFRAAPALGAGLAVPDGIAGGPRYGCAYVGPTLHRAGDPLDADARK